MPFSQEELTLKIEAIGEEIKQQVIADFNRILQEDFSELEKNISKLVLSQNNRILKESEKGLQQVIRRQFGDSIFGTILTDVFLPTIFKGIDSGGLRSGEFSPASGQKFLEISKAITRAQSRNG